MRAWPIATPPLRPDLAQSWREQPVFFVATAPSRRRPRQSVAEGPRHLRGARPERVAYLDLTGSGVETIAHLRENGRITLMLCAFEGDPEHLPRVRPRRPCTRSAAPSFDALAPDFPELPGARSIIEVAVDRVSTSCGYAVPLMDYVGERDRLLEWAEPQGRRRARRVPAEEERREHRRPARAMRRVTAVNARTGSHGCARAWTSSASTCCCSRSAPTCRTSRATRRCRSSDSRCSCCRATATPRSWSRGSKRHACRRDGPTCSRLVPWEETDDPIAIVAGLIRHCGARGRDRRPHLGPLRARPAGTRSPTTASCRATRRRRVRAHGQGRRRDRRAHARRARASTRSPREMRDAAVRAAAPSSTCTASWSSGCSSGHQRANFAIVAAGANAASPHHEPTATRRSPTATSCCATSAARWTATAPTSRACSTSVTPPAGGRRGVRGARRRAGSRRARRRRSARRARRSTTRARAVIATPGLGEYFIHRTGHGIGIEAHEDPYMVAGNATPLAAGHAFSVEPGHLLPGPVRHAARGHRRRHRRRSAPAQRRAARPRDRRLTGSVRLDSARSCSSGRPAGCCSLGDHAPPRGRARLRLAVARRLRRRWPRLPRSVFATGVTSGAHRRRGRRFDRGRGRDRHRARGVSRAPARRRTRSAGGARRAPVAAMVGEGGRADEDGRRRHNHGPEFPPALDLVAPAFGFASLLAAAVLAGGPYRSRRCASSWARSSSAA